MNKEKPGESEKSIPFKIPFQKSMKFQLGATETYRPIWARLITSGNKALRDNGGVTSSEADIDMRWNNWKRPERHKSQNLEERLERL